MNWLEKLNELKRKSKKTTDDIAALSGIPKGTLNKLFAGQTKDPQLSTISAVVHCLGYTLDDLADAEKPATISDDGLVGDFINLYNGLTPEKQDIIMATMKAMRKD